MDSQPKLFDPASYLSETARLLQALPLGKHPSYNRMLSLAPKLKWVSDLVDIEETDA